MADISCDASGLLSRDAFSASRSRRPSLRRGDRLRLRRSPFRSRLLRRSARFRCRSRDRDLRRRSLWRRAGESAEPDRRRFRSLPIGAEKSSDVKNKSLRKQEYDLKFLIRTEARLFAKRFFFLTAAA